MKNIVFLSGLPRTGSTLLTSILSQNPEIHTSGNSALCQLMWDMQVSCQNTEQIKNKPEVTESLLKSIPKVYYEKNQGIIVDKCRSWTMPANLELIDKYITKSPKIVVMLRPVIDIVKSFVYIRTLNGWKYPETQLLDDGSDPIMRSLDGVKHSRLVNKGQFLYIQYDDLITDPHNTLEQIYGFYGWKQFNHQLDAIQNKSFERDDLLNMIGLHDIRPTLSRRTVEISLSDELYKKAISLSEEESNSFLLQPAQEVNNGNN